MVEHLHRASFTAPRVPREEMIGALQEALNADIHYALPQNYMASVLHMCASSSHVTRCLIDRGRRYILFGENDR